MRIVNHVVVAAGLAATAGGADVTGSADHPAISRYEGSEIVAFEAKNYETLLVPTAKVAFAGGKNTFTKAVNPEGDVTRILYKAPVGRTSLEVFRNYESALKAAGFQVLFSCTRTACGDADTFAQTLYGVGAQPLTLNQRAQAYLSAKLARPGGEVYVRLFTVENNSWAGEAKTAEGQVLAQLDVVETKGMEGGMVDVDADAMRAAIRDTGRVALYGIHFDSGRAEVKPESGPALEQIAALLAGSPSLKLLVVGHTDTDGAMAANRDLSERRAAAVVRTLTSDHGVSASRLTPVGVGFAAPVASNRTAEGKAKNRRVELVEY